MSSFMGSAVEFVQRSNTVGVALAAAVLALLLVAELLHPESRPRLRRVVRLLDIAAVPAVVAIVALIILRFALIR